MDGQDLTYLQLNTLLNHFTTYYVQLRRDEKKEASSSWKPIVEDIILPYVRERNDYLASLQILYSGSSYEGTKVGEPDEFDLMLVMKNAVFREVKGLPGVSRPPTGFTIGILTTETESKSPCCAKDVKADLAKLVKEAILQYSFKSVTVHCSGPAVTLKITNENRREYSVDLTLAIKYESWPEDAMEWRTRHRNGWPTQSLIEEILQDCCHLVVKKTKEKNLPQQEKEFLLRYSFSEAEKKLFNKGGHREEGSCWKKVLRILKALRKELHLGPLNSYHLKTVLLYECEANPDPSQWSHEKLSERFIGVLQRLENCLFNHNCPHYFIKHLNLFDKQFSRKRCLDLAKKVRKIRLRPGELFTYYVIFQSMQQSAEHTIEEYLMETLQQELEPILQNDMVSLLKQTLWQALEQALRCVQGQVQEQSRVQALEASWQDLQDEAEALTILGEDLGQALVQERGREFFQVLEQALLEGLEQVPEQGKQGRKQALGKAVGKAVGKALGRALGQISGQISGQTLGIILKQSPEAFISFYTSLFIYILTLDSFVSVEWIEWAVETSRLKY